VPRPLSLDLRKRIVEAVEDGATYEEAARRFGVGEASVSRFMRRWREAGSLEPNPMGGRRFGITDEESLALLRKLVEEKPDRLVVELKELFEEQSGKSTSESGIKRALKKLGFRRKKKGFVATERGSDRVKMARKAFMARMPQLDARRLVFIDETWTSIGMARPYARSPRGKVVMDDVPSRHRSTVTLLGGMTMDGLIATMTVDSGTDTEVFLAFLSEVLLPKLDPGDILIMDNLAAHHSQRVRDLLVEWRIGVLFLPPYSPDLNPIEMAWAKLKTWLRTARARTRRALDRAVAWGMDLITSDEAKNYVRHAGYVLPPS
jgi:transposase